MVVGKPDFELNSFGIQYKEKKVNYTNKKAGINVLSNNQTENEHAAENKISNIAAEAAKKDPKKKLTHSNQPTTRNATEAEQATGKKFENKDPQKPTSTTPSSVTPKDGVFDNVPQTKEDMITQEGGSSHKKKEPAMPRTKLHGRAHQDAKATLRESKQNPVLPKNAANEIILKMNILKLDLMKYNEFQDTSTNARISPSGESKHLKDVKHPDGLALREASTIDHRVGNTAPLERKDTSIKQPRQTGKRGAPKVDPRMRKKDPIKTIPKTAANEIILKMNIMKLDGFGEESASARRSNNYEENVKPLPKSGKSPIKGDDQGTWNTHNYPNRTDDARLVPSSESSSWASYDDSEQKKIQRQGTKQLPKTGESPKDLGKSASETIFKAISLKLDLVKALASNAGSTLVAAGTKKGKPNHIGNNGVRTQDGQHTVRGKGVGTPEQVTIDGVKTTQPRTVAVKPKGNKKTSLEGDMQMSKEIENKTPTELKERMDYITNSPAYQESIHRDAPLTEKEGTEKFDNADPKTQAIRARIAARNAKKKSIDEINSMTDGMKELLKREGVKIGMGEKDTRQMTDRFNEEWGLPDTKEGKNAKRMLDDHVSPV